MNTVSRSAALRVATFLAFALLAGGCSKSPEEVKAAQAAETARTTGNLLVKSNLPEAVIKATGADGIVREGQVNQPIPALPPGRYAVTAGFETWPEQHAQVTVQAGQTAEIAFNFASGSLRLESTPGGASVRLGATVLGKTPLVIPRMPVGEYPISLEYPTWPPVVHNVAIAENVETKANVRLPHGRIALDSHPSGAAVLLGRKTLGNTPLTIDLLPAGVRKFTLQAKNFPAMEVSVTVVDREEVKARPILGLVYPALDPGELLRDVWIPDDRSKISTGFNATTGIYRPKNDIVKNLHREGLYNRWLRKTFRYSGPIKSYDAVNGRVEFAEQKSELSRYRVVAQVKPVANPGAPLPKDVTLSVYGVLSAVEEPSWPNRVITLELYGAELMPTDGTP